MNILFIGGTGNISTACAALLHERGHRVSVLTRGKRPVPSAYTAIRADRCDVEGMATAFANVDVDVVINFLGFDTPELEVDLGVFANRIRHYIFISSATVYAKPHAVLPITEETPLGNPFSPYAQRKQACEDWLMQRCSPDAFPVTIVRPSHTYCQSWLPNVVSSAGYTLAARMRAGKAVFVPDDGQGLWTLTASSDFAVGLAGLCGRGQSVGEAYHITSDEVLTWQQIYREAARAFGVHEPRIDCIPMEFILKHAPQLEAGIRGDKINPAVFDNAKIKAAVPDFQCRKPLRDGMTEAAAWFDADSARQVINPDADSTFETVTAAFRQKRGK